MRVQVQSQVQSQVKSWGQSVVQVPSQVKPRVSLRGAVPVTPGGAERDQAADREPAGRGLGPLAAAFGVFSVAWFVFAYGVADRVPAGVAGWLSTVLYSGWSIGMAGLAVGSVVRRRAGGDRIWIPLTAGLVALVAGDLLWDLSAHGLVPAPNDTPSVMDAFYLPAYAAVGFTAFHLVRRYHRRGAGAVLDTLVVTAGVVAGVFPLIIRPYEDALSSGSVLARVIDVAYPTGDLLLVAALAAGAYTALRVPSLRMLSLAAGCCLVADHVYLQQTQAGTYVATGSWVDWLWLAQYTLMAAAVIVPLPAGAGHLSETALAQRVSTLVASALLCPALFLVVQLGFLDDLGPATDLSFAVSTLVLVCLVCARLAHLLFENARTVDDLRTALADTERLSTDLHHQALHDAVTGLPNRRHLAERIRLARGPHAVVAIDLDDFTAVNDDLGPAAGDLLLREVAARLRGAARPGDLVARLGGDEFAVLMAADPAGEPEPEAVRLSNRLLEAVSAPMVVGGRTVVLGASAGVAVIAGEMADTTGDPEVDGLVRADVAMYAAKRAGRNTVLTYTSEMRAELLSGPGLAGDLARVVRDGGLDVAYQPIVDLTTGRVTSLEALVRWNHPVLGPLAPLRFLPLAAERGLIAELDLFVLETGLARMSSWAGSHPGLRVGFNASAELLARDDLVERVLGALARHGLPGTVLTAEVTEQSLIDEPNGTAMRLQRLRDAGVTVALDDFGTGYSSLSYLQELPVDVLKLDRSFVTRGVTGEQVSPLVRTVIDLGHELGLRVLAEGIETAGQEHALVVAGCDLGQGRLFSAAVPAAEVPGLLGSSDNLALNVTRPRGAR